MSRDAVVYVYTNNSDSGSRDGYVGRVVGFAGRPRIGTAYNYTNNLSQISGADRLLEDGATRLLEDGTDRTLE